MTAQGTAIPRLQDLSYFEVAMSQLLRGATFEEVRRSVVERARDLDREADLDGSFDEMKWERTRNDITEHVNNAVDVLKEAMKFGWVQPAVLPSTPRSAYLHTGDVYELLPPGRRWAELVAQDRPAAYNELAGTLMDAHPQITGFLRAVGGRPDSSSASFTIPLLRWDQERHRSEDEYLADLIRVATAASAAGTVGWQSDDAKITTSIRDYVERIRARRKARGKTQTRKEFLNTCEEAVTKLAFSASGTTLDYISMELVRRWTRFLGVANFSYYAPGPYALRLWATGTVAGTGRDVTITRTIGPATRRQALEVLLDVWNERRAGPQPSMYVPVWELRAAVCWRLRIADAEWDKAINELLHGEHDDLRYQVHLDQASLGQIPGSTRPLVLPSSTGLRRIFNVMTIIPSKENT